MNANNSDRYSGIITTLSLLIVIFFTPGKYDAWDMLLGLIGLILAFKYTFEIKKSDYFFTILVSLLYSTSMVAILFTIVQFSACLQSIMAGTFFSSSFNLVISFAIIITITLIYRKNKISLPKSL